MADEFFHSLLLYFVIPIALFSLIMGFREHRLYRTLILGGIGLGLLTVLTLTEGDVCEHCISSASYDFWNWSSELLIHKGGMVVASLFLCSAHIINLRACRRSDCSN